jgi:hypothetical protein
VDDEKAIGLFISASIPFPILPLIENLKVGLPLHTK